MTDFETAKQFFFQGLQSLEANNLQTAESLFARSLQIIPERVSTLNNLSAVKIRLNKFPEAEALALKAIAIENKSAEAWSNLATALTGAGRHDEALQASNRAVESSPAYAMAWLAKAIALRDLAQFDEALRACEEALKLSPDKYEFLFHKSLILKNLHRLNEAEDTYRRALNTRIISSPVYIGERCATQKGEILIINPHPQFDGSFWSFEFLNRFCPNFPGQLGERFKEEFHFNYVFVHDAPQFPIQAHVPRSDFILNNHVNGEVLRSESNLSGFIHYLEQFGVPVVNHPAKAIPTARDLVTKLLQDIPGVLVPKTLRFSRAGKSVEQVVGEIEKQFDFPLITRTLGSQEGQGMNKIDSRNTLVEVISAADCPDGFFVTQFVDSRGRNKLFRKIRAAIVKDEIIIVRVDHDTNWKIYARKSDERVAFYQQNAHLFDEEKWVVNDPETALGRRAVQSLRAIRHRIPLDIFGIDFDVAPEGLLIFYEANATMNLFSTARKEIPYPKEAEDRLKQAFHRYFTSLLNTE